MKKIVILRECEVKLIEDLKKEIVNRELIIRKLQLEIEQFRDWLKENKDKWCNFSI